MHYGRNRTLDLGKNSLHKSPRKGRNAIKMTEYNEPDSNMETFFEKNSTAVVTIDNPVKDNNSTKAIINGTWNGMKIRNPL